MKRILAALLLISVLPVLLCGCQKRQLDEPGKASTTCANITMGQGAFAARDGFIYMRDYEQILEYDLYTGKTVKLPVAHGIYSANINVQTDHIYYTDFGADNIFRSNREGKEVETLLDDELWGGLEFYIDGEDCFYLVNASTETEAIVHLYRNSLTFDSPECISEDIFTYYVDDQNIYIITHEDDDSFQLHSSPKDTVKFERIPLSFDPICVCTDEDTVYLATAQQEEPPYSYQLIRYADQKETPLPIYALYYQILDGHVIFMDEMSFDGDYDLKAYDLFSGEIKTIFEDIMEYGVVEDRYVCAVSRDSGAVSSSVWMLYDWQTGETKQMYPQ